MKPPRRQRDRVAERSPWRKPQGREASRTPPLKQAKRSVSYSRGEASYAVASRREEKRRTTIFDEQQDHYQLLYVGWRGNKRDFGCLLHLDIKDGKIWIQHDGTEVGIANQLVEMGVPKQDIILAFHEPYIRQFTEFGS
ncbi:MAG: XisI protein [Scytonema sp. PMC 1070.18]|nr:XisI protein [Scytonema sp. PMC 1070.18]